MSARFFRLPLLPRFLLRGVRASNALLTVGTALAASAVGMQTDWGRQWPPRARPDAPAAPAPAVADTALLPPFALPQFDGGLSQAEARPLFVPTRRPAPPPPPAAPVVVMRKGQFVLLGTSVAKDLAEIALLKEVATNRSHLVRKGAQINGITLERVETARVLLRQGGDSEELRMKTQLAAKGPAAGANVPHVSPGGPSPAASQAVPQFVPPPQPSAAPPGPAQATQEEILARHRALREKMLQQLQQRQRRP